MTYRAGVWIDHRKAVIVKVSPGHADSTTVTSMVEHHPERGGDSPLKGAYESQQVPADNSRQRAFTAGLNTYYDAVIHSIGDISPLIIFGPGEAKVELQKRLLATKPAIQVVLLQPADKMTNNQITAKVRTYFGFGAPRRSDPV